MGGRADADLTALLARVDRALGQALPGVEEVTGEVSEPVLARDWARCTLLQPSGGELVVLQLFFGHAHLRRARGDAAPAALERLLAPGQTITVAGRVRRSPRTGRIELRVEQVDAAEGEGLLARRRREAEARLRAEGLLDRLRRAATDANQAVLLVRGGGSGLALSPFDTEPVARAVAQAPVPVLTGIGHQRNHTLADAAAHRACITPTGAAESVVRRLRQAEVQLQQAAERALVAVETARLQRQARWRQVRRGALAAAASAVAALQVRNWLLLTVTVAAARARWPRGRSR